MSKYVLDENKPHLGGNFADGDPATWCPSAWKYILTKYNVKSVMDVGAGRGWAAKWFAEQGASVVAIEGLKENVDTAVVPMVLHDLTEGPFTANVEFVNCIEVVEHIEEKYIENLLDTLCQGSLLLMTHAVPGQKGWHHVNCQVSQYWIDHLARKGFALMSDDTSEIQKLAASDGGKHIARNGVLFARLR